MTMTALPPPGDISHAGVIDPVKVNGQRRRTLPRLPEYY
jgi:hypothetical protein